MTRRDEFNSPEYDAAVSKSLSELVTINQNGKPRQMKKVDVLIESRNAAAMRGNTHALRQALEDQRRIEEIEHVKAKEDAQYWLKFRTNQERRFAKHLKVHGDEPLDFPHPKDIEVYADHKVRFRGPMTLDDHREMLKTIKLIDALMLQGALDNARAGIRNEWVPHEGDHFVIALILNQTLPPRLALTQDAFIDKKMRLASLSQRILLKDTRKAWKKAGADTKRGAFFDTKAAAMGMKAIGRVMALAQGPDIVDEQWDEEVAKIVRDELG